MIDYELAAKIDHTFLKPDGSVDAIRKLCREAKKYRFASVCVNPCEVKTAAKLLKGSEVKVCAVVGFPLGQNTLDCKLFEALEAVKDGARELDFVINQRLLKAAAAGGRQALVDLEFELKACAMIDYFTEKRDSLAVSIVTKLILECCNLTDDEKVLACRLAKKAGFHFVKTSTGFGKSGATVRDVKLLRKTVGRKLGVKAAGGIRTREDALAMLAAGATRLGCSCGVELVTAAN